MEADVLQQYAVPITPKVMRNLKVIGLISDPTREPGGWLRTILLRAIEETLEREPVHQLEHWGQDHGWFYHGTLAEEEWVLLKLKFFA